MPDLKLYVAPGSCARVSTVALEEIGVPFDTELVRTATAQQKSPEYLKVNPKGKVPVMVVDGVPLTENVAILTWLHRTYPEAHLLPETTDTFEICQQIADLAFFSGTVHPHVTRIAMPMKFIADAELAFDIVRKKGASDIHPVLSLIDQKLEGQTWWYGDTWSIVDAYIFWVWWRLDVVGFDDSAYPNIRDLVVRIQERPSVQRAMAREDVNNDILKAEGNYRDHR